VPSSNAGCVKYVVARANDGPRRAQRTSDNDEDLDFEHADHTVQFNTKEEAAEREELTVSIRGMTGHAHAARECHTMRFMASGSSVLSLRHGYFRCFGGRFLGMIRCFYCSGGLLPKRSKGRCFSHYQSWPSTPWKARMIGYRPPRLHHPQFERQKTLRQLGGDLASDTGVINLRAVAFWCLAKRERLWAEDEVSQHHPLRSATCVCPENSPSVQTTLFRPCQFRSTVIPAWFLLLLFVLFSCLLKPLGAAMMVNETGSGQVHYHSAHEPAHLCPMQSSTNTAVD